MRPRRWRARARRIPSPSRRHPRRPCLPIGGVGTGSAAAAFAPGPSGAGLRCGRGGREQRRAGIPVDRGASRSVRVARLGRPSRRRGTVGRSDGERCGHRHRRGNRKGALNRHDCPGIGQSRRDGRAKRLNNRQIGSGRRNGVDRHNRVGDGHRERCGYGSNGFRRNQRRSEPVREGLRRPDQGYGEQRRRRCHHARKPLCSDGSHRVAPCPFRSRRTVSDLGLPTVKGP